MTLYSDTIDRFVTAGLEAWELSLKIAETMAASQAVIGARMAMLRAGLENPGRLPFGEFSRLVPEKASAFGKANAGAARALRRRDGAPNVTMSDSIALLDWWETSIKAAGAWWMPIHAQAVANARRLT